MAGAAGPARGPRAVSLHAVSLHAVTLHAALLLLACLASCAGAAGVEVDDKGAELPPRRFPSGPNLEKLRLGNDSRLLQQGLQGPPPVVTAANQTAPVPPAATARPFLEPTKSAAVLIGVFVCIALVGYFALMVWRRVLERRYGNREILVNEEQFEQDRDLRNFQL